MTATQLLILRAAILTGAAIAFYMVAGCQSPDFRTPNADIPANFR